MRRDGKSEMELQIVQQETDDILSSVFLLSESFFEGGDGDVEDSAFGIGLELVVAVDGEIGACWEVGFVAAACLTAEVVDGGIFFVAADAGIVAADLCGQAGGELPAFLQGLASLICGAPALFPSLSAPTFRFEVFFGHGQQLGGEGNISTARVLGLRRLQITDEKWQRAMDALSDSLQVHISKPFVRVYRRGEDGEYQLMNLDVAKV